MKKDPPPKEYVKWLLEHTTEHASDIPRATTHFILTELKRSQDTKAGQLYFEQCIKDLKELP